METWKEKVATEFAGVELSKGQIIALLESAAEISTVRLKVLIGRCYEVIQIARVDETVPNATDEFVKTLLDVIR